MCGITGFIEAVTDKPAALLASIVTRMADQLWRRGPDSCGAWVDQRTGIALGHRRLAILDLSPTGQQPMISADNRFIIAFNGEIYNHLELRTILGQAGYRFNGTSDTEVMLAACCHWGVVTALTHFVGAFAMAIWDARERQLYLVRDRMGEKPLYYGHAGSTFLFGSELKALRAHPAWEGSIDRDALALLLRFCYIPCPHSIFYDIHQLMPGTYLQIDLAARLDPAILPEPVPYWSLKEAAEDGNAHPFTGSDDEAIDELEAMLMETIAGQTIADVPVGAFLSGGIDSSLVTALMTAQSAKPVKTFTIAFDDPAYSEARYARAVARHLGTDHTELIVTHADALNIIPSLPTLYDEPFADSSQVPTHLVSQLTRRQVTVALTGDGGDEFFYGYNSHVRLQRLWQQMRGIPQPLRAALSRLLQAVPSSIYEGSLRKFKMKSSVLADQVQKFAAMLPLSSPEAMYERIMTFWPNAVDVVLGARVVPTIFSSPAGWPEVDEFIDRLVYIGGMTNLCSDMLVKVDRAAMGCSLETRVPLLDHRVVEYAWRLPLRLKIREGQSKWILRQLCYRHIPRGLIEHAKTGFSFPLDEWLKGPLREWAEELLDPARLARENFFQPQLIRESWQQHLSGRKKLQGHLWSVLMFQAWLENQTRHTPVQEPVFSATAAP